MFKFAEFVFQASSYVEVLVTVFRFASYVGGVGYVFQFTGFVCRFTKYVWGDVFLYRFASYFGGFDYYDAEGYESALLVRGEKPEK